MRRLPITLIAALAASTALAQEAPPPLPPENPPAQHGASDQPSVTIHRDGENTIEEYRVNGRLRWVKITPRHGRPYYLVDTNGDGRLDQLRNALDVPPVATWPILKW